MTRTPKIDVGELRVLVSTMEKLIAEASRVTAELKTAIASAEEHSERSGAVASVPERTVASGQEISVEHRSGRDRSTIAVRKPASTPWSRKRAKAPVSAPPAALGTARPVGSPSPAPGAAPAGEPVPGSVTPVPASEPVREPASVPETVVPVRLSVVQPPTGPPVGSRRAAAVGAAGGAQRMTGPVVPAGPPVVGGTHPPDMSPPVVPSRRPPSVDAVEAGGPPRETRHAAGCAESGYAPPTVEGEDRAPGSTVPDPTESSVFPSVRARPGVIDTPADRIRTATRGAVSPPLSKEPPPGPRPDGPSLFPVPEVRSSEPAVAGGPPEPADAEPLPAAPVSAPPPVPDSRSPEVPSAGAEPASASEALAVLRATGGNEDAEAVRLAKDMARRHGLKIRGFEMADIDAATVGEISAVLDDLLSKYAVPLYGIEIVEQREDTVRRERKKLGEAGHPGRPRVWIAVERAELATPGATGEGRTRRRFRRSGTIGRPVRAAVVRAFAAALDEAGDYRARQEAWRILMADSLRGGMDLGSGLLDPGRALIEGFTEVELEGKRAGESAKTLHEALLKMARVKAEESSA